MLHINKYKYKYKYIKEMEGKEVESEILNNIISIIEKKFADRQREIYKAGNRDRKKDRRCMSVSVDDPSRLNSVHQETHCPMIERLKDYICTNFSIQDFSTLPDTLTTPNISDTSDTSHAFLTSQNTYIIPNNNNKPKGKYCIPIKECVKRDVDPVEERIQEIEGKYISMRLSNNESK